MQLTCTVVDPARVKLPRCYLRVSLKVFHLHSSKLCLKSVSTSLFRLLQKLLSLKFDYFKLEACVNCMCDKLEIYTGQDSTPLHRFCGLDYPNLLEIPASRVRIRFSTDSTVEREGFHIHWQWKDAVSAPQFHVHASDVHLCGSVLTEPGRFSSPGYERSPSYPDWTYCTWIIESEAPVSGRVKERMAWLVEITVVNVCFGHV